MSYVAVNVGIGESANVFKADWLCCLNSVHNTANEAAQSKIAKPNYLVT